MLISSSVVPADLAGTESGEKYKKNFHINTSTRDSDCISRDRPLLYGLSAISDRPGPSRYVTSFEGSEFNICA